MKRKKIRAQSRRKHKATVQSVHTPKNTSARTRLRHPCLVAGGLKLISVVRMTSPFQFHRHHATLRLLSSVDPDGDRARHVSFACNVSSSSRSSASSVLKRRPEQPAVQAAGLFGRIRRARAHRSNKYITESEKSNKLATCRGNKTSLLMKELWFRGRVTNSNNKLMEWQHESKRCQRESKNAGGDGREPISHPAGE